MSDNILVLGAGELGTAILEALAKHPSRANAKLSVLLRPSSINSTAPEKKKQIEHLQGLGITPQPGDVESSTSELAAIFRNYDTIISCNGMGRPFGTQTKLADAVFEAGVKRYFPWQFGMDYDAIGTGSDQDRFDEQINIRKKLRAQNKTEWTIVSTGLFMSFLFLTDFGVINLEQKVTRGLGTWDTKITVTVPRDIGRVTADIVFDPRGIANEVVHIAGDTLSYKEIADLVDERFGEGTFRRELWDMETLKKQLAEGQPVAEYKATFAVGKGVAWDREGTVNMARGIQMTGLREYLKDVNLVK
ncbi:hypothetical protein FVER53590_08287 [Fusarium verticillioides]|nr:hypothetical protein FVER14953_08287 [Fusarium verticillioides]RBQ92931.1 hypothetical protein FVER53263_08287 [Fusarium verticillioides]RBQ98858.1 hypothetical protein FVER53590_08287 [Fusarium verticillioides]